MAHPKAARPHITLVTPAAPGSRAGNRATATRWAGLLRRAGWRVSLHVPDDVPPSPAPDLVVALHAWRSHDAIKAWKARYPSVPLILVLTGTDVYRFQYSHPQTVYESMDVADALVGLHDCLDEHLPARYLGRLAIVHQSAEPLPPGAPAPSQRTVDILVAGHLREEKDSLRAAYAVRDLPADSALRVVQLGRAHSEDWAEAACEEMAANARYRWLGDRPHCQVRQWLGRAHAMVVSSRMEGGANVVSEACVAGLPVIASDIAGNRGLLGEDYAGYYPVGDTMALRERLLEVESRPGWLAQLRQQVRHLAPRFHPDQEREALIQVVDGVLARFDQHRKEVS